MGNLFTTFTNCRLCVNGQVLDGERLVVSQDDGLILKSTGYIGGEIVDLDDAIVAPGLLELHANGLGSFHYSDFESPDQYRTKLESVARKYPSHGVTGFWATIPTIEEHNYQKVGTNSHTSMILSLDGL
jgi:N-acetylglucosamine-6-phosphate deacetylase